MEADIRSHLENPTCLTMRAVSGGRLMGLCNIATSIINHHHHPSTCHVYFLAGLCDITYRDFDPNYSHNICYDEVSFTDSPDQTIFRLTNEINSISDHIISLGAKPCFATIVPSSLRAWNETRLEQQKTAFLLHHTQYDDMQANLISAISSINKHIIEVNNSNNMATPYIAETVMSNTGPNKPPRIHYKRLTDGVHPSPTLRDKWINKLVHAIKINRP